jgi:predicted phosphodiesterase
VNQLTIFGDIHANLPALEAVFADMAAHGLDNNLVLPRRPRRLRHLPQRSHRRHPRARHPTIMGNYDQGVGNSSDDCGCAYRTPEARALGDRSIAWSNATPAAENKAFLRTLLPQIPLQLGGLRVLLAHGSPRRINEYLYEDRPDASLERILDQAEADVLVVGHTHKPYHRILPSGRHVVNAGSVGKPKDGDPRAGYVVLRVEDGTLGVDFRRVPYDVERAAQAIEATPPDGGMPHEFAAMLRTGTG